MKVGDKVRVGDFDLYSEFYNPSMDYLRNTIQTVLAIEEVPFDCDETIYAVARNDFEDWWWIKKSDLRPIFSNKYVEVAQ